MLDKFLVSVSEQLFGSCRLILRRVPRPPVSGCEKSRGQIESLLGHQTRRKRLLSPPTYMETCLQHLVFTLLCHKVPENSLKAGECFFLTIKFGEELNWICFDCFSYFISMGFSISDPEADTIKFGEAIVFVSAIFAYFFCRQMALMPLDGVVQKKLYIVSGETLFIKKLLNKYLNIIFEVLVPSAF